MKTKQKRFESEVQIMSEIERLKTEAHESLKAAVESDAAAVRLFKEAGEMDLQLAGPIQGPAREKLYTQWFYKDAEARSQREKSNTCYFRSKRIEEVKIPKLVQALAQMRTGLLSFTTDKGVVLEK